MSDIENSSKRFLTDLLLNEIFKKLLTKIYLFIIYQQQTLNIFKMNEIIFILALLFCYKVINYSFFKNG